MNCLSLKKLDLYKLTVRWVVGRRLLDLCSYNKEAFKVVIVGTMTFGKDRLEIWSRCILCEKVEKPLCKNVIKGKNSDVKNYQILTEPSSVLS